MQALTQDDLLPLEQYDNQRQEIQSRIKAHKAKRRLDLDAHIAMFFEDRDTMWYQVQEMARAERLFKPEELADELAVYNPLIPDGRNLKGTLMIQYDDRAERLQRLTELVGIEDQFWIQVNGYDKVYAIADEDLDRSTQDKTSTVHFMRFEFSDDMVQAWRDGALVRMGCDHANRPMEEELPAELHEELLGDFD